MNVRIYKVLSDQIWLIEVTNEKKNTNYPKNNLFAMFRNNFDKVCVKTDNIHVKLLF